MNTSGVIQGLKCKLAQIEQRLAHADAVDEALLQRARELEEKILPNLEKLREGERTATSEYQRQWFVASYQDLLADLERARRVQRVILQRQVEQSRRAPMALVGPRSE